jgi:cytochrome c-type biogenesis protein CcmH/NrfG
LAPGDWYPRYLEGVALLAQNRALEAVTAFRQALQIEPNNVTILISLAQMLASDENPQVRDGRTALALAQRAIAHSDGVQPAFLDVLSMAYAETGDFEDAQRTAQDALALVESRHLTNYISIIREQLQLYRNRQPFRSSLNNKPG